MDDASPDDSLRRIQGCAGVRVVPIAHNGGFLRAANTGASHAVGEYLMFLNNDTEVQPGWLDTLVDVLHTRPRVGLVGSKLVYPNGLLQECGGIVWSDGSAYNYGRHDSPREAQYHALREVDYVSGAAIMVRATLFHELGGFDDRYAPAYYEDTDLAFAVRAQGFATMVAPQSVVLHHEGVSHGTKIHPYLEANRQLFQDKWHAPLRGHLPGPGGANLWLASHRTSSAHNGGLVLVADYQVPRPDEDSGSVRMTRLLQLLVDLDQRVVFFPMNHALPPKYSHLLHSAGVTVVASPERQARFLREAGPSLKVAFLSRPEVASAFIKQVRLHAPAARVVYDTVDLHFLRVLRQAEHARDQGDEREAQRLRLLAGEYRRTEVALAQASDVTVTVSEVERVLLTGIVPTAAVEVLSNIHCGTGVRTHPRGRTGVLFVGSFNHHPNQDAARWLAGEIMPLVRAQRPGTVLHIVGSHPQEEIRALADEHVVVHGWVEDLDPAYRAARVVVAPLRFGAGVKGKVGESLAQGVPVVATALACEGMALADGRHVLLGDSAADLARQLVTLLDDDALWSELAAAGQAAAQHQFGPQVARATLERLLGGAVG